MKAVVELNNVSKTYFKKVALNQITLNFAKGKIYGLLGPNGSGKTTLMKIVAGLHKHTSGSVLVDDQPISYKSKAMVVFMPTENYLYPSMKVKTVLQYFRDMYQDFSIAKASGLLEKLELNAENKVSELSTGLNGRLKVALAVSRAAPVYLFDEPLNGLDPISRKIVRNLIAEVAGDNNAVIVSSHLVSELEPILDRAILLKDGSVALNEGAEEIRIQKGKSVEELYEEVYRS